jgi:hypothetical protein
MVMLEPLANPAQLPMPGKTFSDEPFAKTLVFWTKLIGSSDNIYIFTVDAFDNIEGLANNGVVTMIPRPERTKVSFELKDDTAPTLAAVNMEFRDGQSAAVTSANEGKLWYLGPEDPSIPTPAGVPIPKEVPTFEHVFHSVSADNSVGNRYMRIAATDRCGHKRHLAVHFKVSEVTNELRVLEEKIKRELKAQKDK